MAEFVWEARARTGEVRKGAMEAESEEAVNQRLRSQQLQPTKVKKKSREGRFQLGSTGRCLISAGHFLPVIRRPP